MAAVASTNAPVVLNVQAPTLEGVNAEMTRVEADSGLEAKLKQTVLEQYRAAAQLLTAAGQNRQQAATLQAAITSAPEETSRLRQQLEELGARVQEQTNPLAGFDTNAPLAELEQMLALVKSEADAHRSQLSEVEEALDNRRKRPTSAIAGKAAAQEELRGAETGLGADPTPDLPTAAVRARRVLLEARRIAANSQLALIDQDLLAQSTQVALLTARQGLRTREAAVAAQQQKALEQLVEAGRAAAANADRDRAAQIQRAASADESVHPLIRELANQNAELASRRAAVITLNQRVSADLKSETEKQRSLELASENSRKQIEAAGLNETLADILLLQRRRLESPRVVRERMGGVRAMISTNALAQLAVDEQVRQLVIARDHLEELLAARDDLPPGAAEREALERKGMEFLTTRQELLTGLQQSYGQLVENLRLLSGGQVAYLTGLENYIQFLDEILMWTPSSAPLGLAMLTNLPPAIEWWSRPAHWREAGGVLTRRMAQAYVPLGLATVLVLLLLLARSRLLRTQQQLSALVRRASTDSFQLTLKAVPLPLLLALPVPLAAAAIGLTLVTDPQSVGSDFVRAAGLGFLALGVQSILMLVVYELCRTDGLGHAHFRWREENLQRVRRNILWLLPIQLVLRFVTAVSHTPTAEGAHGTLGEVLFLLGTGAMLVFTYRVMHPRRGILRHIIRRRPKGLVARLQWLWFGLLLAIPVSLAVLAGMGYFYTALQLNIRLGLSVAMIIGVSLAYNLVIRWLFVRERHLAFEQAMQKRANAARQTEDESTDEPMLGQVEEPEMSLGAIKAQTRQLLRVSLTLAIAVGLWFVWESELPALNYLHNFKLWSVTGGVEGATQLVPVTLADVLGALLVGLLTVVAARNLPGLLEIVVLQNLSLQPGSRYAITAISQYVVVAIGTIVTLGALGLRWNQLGWIAAALSVGLGFGLQEVVANFVCGILLFLERPVRVGDVVTVGDASRAWCHGFKSAPPPSPTGNARNSSCPTASSSPAAS